MTNQYPYTNERTGRTEWLSPAEARNRAELRRQSHRPAGFPAPTAADALTFDECGDAGVDGTGRTL